MFNLSDNYYLRKCFLQREQVPTQSMMKKKMSPKLADVYFKSMSPKLKVIAGLEPSLKGGGTDWYIPPKELLEGRVVLKPVKNEVLAKLNYEGIDDIGMKLFEKHCKDIELEKQSLLFEADLKWRHDIDVICRQTRADAIIEANTKTSQCIHNAYDYFAYLYRMTLNKFETLLHEAAIAEIKKTSDNAFRDMENRYAATMKEQATMLYDRYNKKLMDEKNRLKEEFMENLEICRADMADKVHDLNVDKHRAIEKLRHFLECQSLACQIYVALKERENCLQEIEESKRKHQKKVKTLTDKIKFKDLEIHLAEQKQRKRREFDLTWQKKVCHVVKKFQIFVSYCLNMLPEHAEFFINLEKLMMLQLNEVLEEPTADSIIVVEEKLFYTPEPRPHPYYLFCDRSYKPKLDRDLCPKRCTSSASQLPVIIINKRCIYAACDNFEQFTNKIKDYIHGKRGDDADFEDYTKYENLVPVKYTSSQQLLELKLESSLLQVLQQEVPNIKEVPISCNICGLSSCFCTQIDSTLVDASNRQPSPSLRSSSGETENEFVYTSADVLRTTELDHEREPKWESFLRYIEPRKCSKCVKSTKKHLAEHLPVYMRHMSTFEPPQIPKYEKCSVTTMKHLVKLARGQTPVPKLPGPSKTRDIGIQYIDPEFELLCTCFSDGAIKRLLSDLTIDPTMFATSNNQNEGDFKVVGSSVSAAYMTKRASSFATDRAYSLRNIIDDLPEIQQIFKKTDCSFE